MDFFKAKVRKNGKKTEVYPEFLSRKSRDLMTRGGKFYAIWDEEAGLWSTDIYRVVELVDAELRRVAAEFDQPYIRWMEEHSTGSHDAFLRYVRNNENNYHQLNQFLAFSNTKVKKTDYISHRLDYALEDGAHDAWDELVGKLYSEEELAKIEWAIGSVVAGDSVDIQKFIVLYGSAKTGKSTVLHIIERLFSGYTNVFDAKALGSNGTSFALEVFKENPLVGIQHDGDLSRIEDNTRLNSLVSHENMVINEKYKSQYNVRINTFLFMGTNNPVKISDSRSGLLRRLIDVQPTGNLHTFDHYQVLMSRIEFELGAIASHCLRVYQSMGKNYYDNYRPTKMMYSTNVFYNFVEAYLPELKAPDGITLKRAYALYKEFCTESNNKPMQMQIFRNEMMNYYENFVERTMVDGQEVYSLFKDFKLEKLTGVAPSSPKSFSINLAQRRSLLDDILADMPAQYATETGKPSKRWGLVKTTLTDLDTSLVHYVKIPKNHIVIDFDLRDESGEKSLDKNLEAASAWPPTYTELSMSGKGLHLHYIYNGDIKELDNEYSPGIEIKTLLGDSSLRRRLSRCNDHEVAQITSGLPMKERKMIDVKQIKSERGLREMIARNLRKEIHPNTKSSIDFIKKVLDDAYSSDLSYDVTDLRSSIVAFANNSTNRPLECLRLVREMKFKSEDRTVSISGEGDALVYFDVEVYPNLFVLCWKFEGDHPVVRMINPKPDDIEPLLAQKLVGFNNRRYDNHILYAAFLGYDNERLYRLSQALIVDKNRNATFGEAYGLSYADVYDYSSKKQGLKKFQIELGIVHKELDHPWDEPVPEERWIEVADYCANDVVATEKVAESRAQDFVARQILASISGLSVNDTTQKHTARIVFEGDPSPQGSFVYTDLSELFPGYIFEGGKSSYRGEDPSEGGYVYAEPGMYENVAVLDVASMHPTSIRLLNLFGPYTKNFNDLLDARLAIKKGDYSAAAQMLDGKLASFISDADTQSAKDLSHALKIVINIVYGLTSAKFDTVFRDPRNKDNIVAKRGALFMIDLKHAIQEQGFPVVHIKTDSVKIPNATPDIIQFVTEFGERYGYTFDHEKTYEKFCLVNDAVYIAREGDKWDAVGAQFQHPYVYRTLFTHDEIHLQDLCEVRSVTNGAIYIDFGDERMHFVGRSGSFVPVREGTGGGTLYRVKDGRKYALSGTKGYFWKEAAVVKELGPSEWQNIDKSFYQALVEDAVDTIERFGSFEAFVS